MIGGGRLALCGSLLGWMAQPESQSGNWFHAEALQKHGGYIGAVIGYLLHIGLGQAKSVVLGALGLVGALMMFNIPLVSLFRGIGRVLWTGWRGTATATRAVAEVASHTAEKATTVLKRKPERPTPRVVQKPSGAAPAEASAPSPNFSRLRAICRGRLRARSVVPAYLLAPNRISPRRRLASEGNYTLPPLSLLKEPPAPPRRSQSEVKRKRLRSWSARWKSLASARMWWKSRTVPTVWRYGFS